MVASQVLGLATFFITLPLFALSFFWSPSATFGFFPLVPIIVSIPGSSLFVRRAHDLGWPAALPIGALILTLAVALALMARFGVFGAAAAEPRWLAFATSTPLVMVVFGLGGLLSLWLTFVDGQPGANRYGPAPA